MIEVKNISDFNKFMRKWRIGKTINEVINFRDLFLWKQKFGFSMEYKLGYTFWVKRYTAFK